ncbi:MBL fold metallo-hydrolase [Streptomyces sp. NRRL F-5126]|uniref:MBL fold metallo-hydrolase n=1 Tax=Streptomyces sp. NRRL F-5126 TaxID=1463857 RepID=UPI0004C7622F|nr:MBL fold metallo-hydrolase [Streptomyces sp. NRRL F-5126]
MSGQSETTARTDTLELGDVTVTRVVEWSGRIRTVGEMVPDSPEEVREEHRAELVPDFWDPRDDAYLCAVQSWIIRSEGRVIVVDTGAGNDRDRPQVPPFDHLSTPFLDNLARAGVRPEDVDVVVNTHVHYDHVGWNTRLDDGAWVPTFPRATYLIPRVDREYFDPANEHLRPAARSDADRLRREGNRLVFADSVQPILDSGRAVLWEDRHRIDADLELRAAPGHTPGSSALWLRSGTERAVFVGDMLHSPVQLWTPHANSCFCEDPRQSRETRRRVLAEAADTRALVLPAHFPGRGAARVKHEGDRFEIREWAPLDRLTAS